MAILREDLIRENAINFVGDLPAYAFIAYANFAQVLPTDYAEWEYFLLKHGWLILLVARLLIALYDLALRVNGNFFLVDVDGKPRKRSLWSIFSGFIKQLF